ncbi:amino acid adenylation domain-containing protein [Rhodococcus qingshengii]|uniref:amino acid adenylation domain-containing protein n=1 Tax=Rhodococcus qingshengii TaxID=334542 RepID=UPI0037C6CF0E
MTIEIVDVLALTPLQEGLYALASLSEGNDIYTIAVLTDFHGDFEGHEVAEAIDAVLARHPNLAVSFVADGLPHPVQLVPDKASVHWREIECTDDELDMVVVTEQRAAFDLEDGPLLRAVWAKTAPDRHRLLLVLHHLIIDGWSVPLLWNEIAAALGSDAVKVVTVPAPYRDHVAWLNERDRDESVEYWSRYLRGLDGPTRVGTVPDRDSPAAKPQMTMRFIDGEELDDVLTWVRANNLTVNTIAQVAWAILLSRLTGRTDVTFGVTVSGRPEEVPGIESMIGLFINTVPCRIQLSDKERTDRNVLDLCRRVQSDSASGRAYGYLGLSEVQRTVGIGELFDTLMIFHNSPKGSARETISVPNGRGISPVSMDSFTHYPLVVVPFLLDERLYVNIDYDDSRLSGLDAGDLAERFLHVLRSITRTSETSPRAIDILLPGESEALLRQGAGPQSARRSVAASRSEAFDYGVHRTFEAAVDADPDRVAVVFRDTEVTYRVLDAWANSIAADLAHCGIRSGDRVGIAVTRSPAYFAAMLAVLKTGAVCVPFDIAAPERRNATIADTASLALVVGEQGCSPWWGGHTIVIDSAPVQLSSIRPSVAVYPDSAQYIVFTSGSTGEPKGVTATHGGILALLAAHRTLVYDVAADDGWELLRIGHTWSFAFDASWQPQLGLLAGHTIVLFDEETQRDPALTLDRIRRDRIDMLDTTPSMFAQLEAAGLTEEGRCALRIVALGGEAISAATWVRLSEFDGSHAYNFYGPTEITVEAVASAIEPGTSPQIGRPTAHSHVRVLGPDLRPVPVGVVGELYISGPQVARGYHDRFRLTAERFVADIDDAGRRMYRTGDLVRWTRSATLEFLGRADDQVKIRGYRVEIAEIVSALDAHPDTEQSAVIVDRHRRGGAALIGYVATRRHEEPSLRSDLLRHLAVQLPGYMIPAQLHTLESLPTTLNGKLDVSSLPTTEAVSIGGSDAPESEAEKAVADALATVLGVDAIGLDTEYFAAGMDSIAAISVSGELRAAGYDCRPRAVLESSTARTLASLVTIGLTQDESFTEGEEGDRLVDTPILAWMAGRADIRRFSMSHLISCPPHAAHADVTVCLDAVLRAHPHLSASLVVENCRPRLIEHAGRIADAAAVLPQLQVDVLDASVIAQIGKRAVDRLDPEAGMMVAGTFIVHGSERLMFLTIHHAVADIVSWNIVLGDLAHAWEGLSAGAEPEVLSEVTSIHQWAKAVNTRLVESVTDRTSLTGADLTADAVVKDRLFTSAKVDGLATEHDSALRGSRTIRKSADSRTTAALVVSSMSVEKAVLAALAWARFSLLRKHGRAPSAGLVVDRETHGRTDHIDIDIDGRPADLSRTVGWFNVLEQVRIDGNESPLIGIEDAATAGLESMANVHTTHGSSEYALDQWLWRMRPEQTTSVRPEFLVSYLGRIDQRKPRAGRPWTSVTDPAIVGVLSENNNLAMSPVHAVELIAALHIGEDSSTIETLWRFDPSRVDEVLVEDLATHWCGAIRTAAAVIGGASNITRTEKNQSCTR